MVFLHSPGVDETITLCQAEASDPVGSGGVSHFGFSIAKNNLDEMVRQVVSAGGKVQSRQMFFERRSHPAGGISTG